MKSKKTTAVSVRKKILLPPLFGLFVLTRATEAQQSTIQPQMPPVESVSELNMTNDFQVFGQLPQATAPMPYEPFRWDQFVVRPHADYQFLYADGILSSPGHPQNTTIQQVSPGILINLGPHWALDYTATLGFYSNNNFGTEFNNAINLTGQTVYTDWIFGFQQSVLLTKSPLIETASQTSQQNYDTAVTGHHENSEHITEDLGVYQNIQTAPGGFEDMQTWSTMDWLNYVPVSRFNIGIGPGLGYTHAEFGPSSFFLQAQARLNWRATDKLSFQLTGGIQETEFLGSEGGRNLFSPIYGANIQFQPFSQTQLSVYGNRSVSPSLFVGQYTETTTIGASISQRLFGQIYVSLDGSYNDQKYTASSTAVVTSRTDHFYSLTARVSHSFLKRGTISVFYEYGSDDSTVAGYSYSSNQFGAEVSYAF